MVPIAHLFVLRYIWTQAAKLSNWSYKLNSFIKFHHCKTFFYIHRSVTSIFYSLQMVFILYLFFLRTIWTQTAKLSRFELKTKFILSYFIIAKKKNLHQVSNKHILAVRNGIYPTFVCLTYYLNPNGETKHIGVKN